MDEDDGRRGVAITRETLRRMVARMIADNRAVAEARTTDGQRALDLAIALLHQEGEIELAAAVGLLHGLRVMGQFAVARALTAILETSAELDPAGFRARVLESN